MYFLYDSNDIDFFFSPVLLLINFMSRRKGQKLFKEKIIPSYNQQLYISLIREGLLYQNLSKPQLVEVADVH